MTGDLIDGEYPVPNYQMGFIAFKSEDGEPVEVALSAVDDKEDMHVWLADITPKTAPELAEQLAERVQAIAGEWLHSDNVESDNEMLKKLMRHHPFGTVEIPVLSIIEAPRLYKDGAKIVDKLRELLAKQPACEDPFEEVQRLAEGWLIANENEDEDTIEDLMRVDIVMIQKSESTGTWQINDMRTKEDIPFEPSSEDLKSLLRAALEALD